LKGKIFPVVMTIAGSDSGGGAGIQADLRTFAYLGTYGTSVITSITAQNPCEVKAIYPLPVKIVLSQLETIFSKISVKSIKTGMLFDSSIIKAVAKFLEKQKNVKIVIDPVMVSTSGSLLLKKTALNALKEYLLPLAKFITPNIEEAQFIIEKKIKNLDEACLAAGEIEAKWGVSCVIKGGHKTYLKGKRIDVVCREQKYYYITGPSIKCSNYVTHGTGCTFSAALAANIAKGMDELDSLYSARLFVHNSLLNAVRIGKKINAMFPLQKDNGDIKICMI